MEYESVRSIRGRIGAVSESNRKDEKQIGKCENKPKIGGFKGLSFPVCQGFGVLTDKGLVPNPHISVTAA